MDARQAADGDGGTDHRRLTARGLPCILQRMAQHRARALVAFLGLLPIVLGCGCVRESASCAAPAAPLVDAKPVRFEYAFAAQADVATAGSQSQFAGASLSLGDRTEPKLASIAVEHDHLGNPALAFELERQSAEAFRAATREHVDDRLAILLDGEIVSVATVNEELPGQGMVSLDGTRTEAEVRDWVARIPTSR